MSTPVIRALSLSKRYGSRPALDCVDLEVQAGECVAVLGANGAGKSTLLRLLCSLSRPTTGEVWLLGRRLERGPGSAGARRPLGYVGHSLLAYRALSVRQNLDFFARLYALAGPQRRITRMLEEFGLTERADHALGSLSRGLQQRLALARAFLHEPQLLFLDEPYNALDSEGAAALTSALVEAGRSGRTVIVATHDLERAASLAGRVAVLRQGRLSHWGEAPREPGALRDLYRRAAVESAA